MLKRELYLAFRSCKIEGWDLVVFQSMFENHYYRRCDVEEDFFKCIGIMDSESLASF